MKSYHFKTEFQEDSYNGRELDVEAETPIDAWELAEKKLGIEDSKKEFISFMREGNKVLFDPYEGIILIEIPEII